MAAALTFIIPVKHEASIEDVGGTMARLRQTLESVDRQAHDGADAVVVANEGCPLPQLPRSATAVFVDLPYRELPSAAKDTRSERHRAIQLDKGSRVLAGLRARDPAGHVMPLDFDDLVSNRLAAFVSSHRDAAGWYVQTGWAHGGGRWVAKLRDFHLYCGTSQILNSALIDGALRGDAVSDDWIRSWLGSHRFLVDHLRDTSRSLSQLPFPGAVYRVGHTGNTSGSGNLRRFLFRPRHLLAHPGRTAIAVTGLRRSERIVGEFGRLE